MVTDLLAVLGEPNRRKLLALLGSGEQTVTQLAAGFDVTRSAISQHLGVLMEAGLVEARAEGRFRYYRLVPDGLAALRSQMEQFWTAEVDALARVGPQSSKESAMSFDRSVFIPVPPDEAFALVTQPERLRRWQVVASRVDLRAGGEFRWTVVPGHVASGTFVEVDPGKRVVFTWGWDHDESLPPGASTITVTLAPGDGGTFVRLVHEGLDAEQSARHAEGWNHFMDRLVALTTDGDAGPDEWAYAPDPIDELIAAEAALAVCQRVALSVTDDKLDLATPCPEFNVAQLVDHLLESLFHLNAMADGPALPRQDTAGAGAGSVEERIAASGAAAIESWRARDMDGTVQIGPMELPANVAAGILSVELLVHGWDLATAVGTPVDVSPVLSDYVIGLVGRLVPPQARDGVRFGPEVAVDPDADALTRLIGFTGRQPTVPANS